MGFFFLVLLGQVGHTFLTAGLDAALVHGLRPAECSKCTSHMLRGKGSDFTDKKYSFSIKQKHKRREQLGNCSWSINSRGDP